MTFSITVKERLITLSFFVFLFVKGPIKESSLNIGNLGWYGKNLAIISDAPTQTTWRTSRSWCGTWPSRSRLRSAPSTPRSTSASTDRRQEAEQPYTWQSSYFPLPDPIPPGSICSSAVASCYWQVHLDPAGAKLIPIPPALQRITSNYTALCIPSFALFCVSLWLASFEACWDSR